MTPSSALGPGTDEEYDPSVMHSPTSTDSTTTSTDRKRLFRDTRTGCAPGRSRRRWRQPLRLTIACILLTGLAATNAAVVQAQPLIENRLEAGMSSLDAVGVYDYASADKSVFETAADWSTGTFDDTLVDADTIVLERFGDVAPTTAHWWDTDWRTRRCYEIDNSSAGAVALTEYQFRVELDTAAEITAGWMQTDGADLRAVGVGDLNLMPVWLEGPTPSTTSSVWVQLATVPIGVSSFCLYWNNAAATTVSDKASIFAYSSPTPIYYAVNAQMAGATTSVVSYAAGNQVQLDGGAVQTLNAGVVTSVGGWTPSSVLSVTGPVIARSATNAQEALVPISFADTTFVLPTNRSVQSYSIHAPFATASVRIFNGSTAVWSGTVPVGTTVTATADVSPGLSGVIRSTEPVLTMHKATNGVDVLMGVRWTGDDLFGVRSRYSQYGFEGAGQTAGVIRSDGTTGTVASTGAGSMIGVYDGVDLDGDGTAIRVNAMTGRTAVAQQADRDGSEATAYLPESVLDNEYWIPTLGNYVTFACPVAGTQIAIAGSGTVPCNGSGAGAPGHGYFGSNNGAGIAAGTRVSSVGGEPFFAYWEDSVSRDETTMLGAKGARKWARVHPTTTVGPREGIHATLPSEGTWTSPAIDTGVTGVYGLLSWKAKVPTSTSIRFQMATGSTSAAASAASFVGPDGTSATFYTTTDQPIEHDHDLDRFYRVKTWLSTSDPLVSPIIDQICVGTDLAEFSGQTSTATVASPAGTVTTHWIARIRADGLVTSAPLDATVHHRGDTGLATVADATIFLTGPNSQIEIVAGAVTLAEGPPQPWGSTNPLSLAVTSELSGGSSTILATWRAADPAGGPFIEHDLLISLTS